MKPLIALTPLIDEKMDNTPWMLQHYFSAVEGAGGLPVMLPPLSGEDDLPELLSHFDGILFTGGHDVDPSVYGREREEGCGLSISPQRDALEVPLLRLAMDRGMPILGICRGIQLINAVLGGTLWQDLPSQHPSDIAHSQKEPHSVKTHEVVLQAGTPLAELLGKERIGVNTSHHQAIRELAPSLRADAYSTDGLVEAVDRPGDSFFWAVQWHPERLFEGDEDSRKILRAFVQACSAARP